jgi:hypothetical protein
MISGLVEETPALKVTKLSWAWWYVPTMSALGRLRQADHKFEAT